MINRNVSYDGAVVWPVEGGIQSVYIMLIHNGKTGISVLLII